MIAGREMYGYKINELSRKLLALLNSEKSHEQLMSDIVLLVQVGLGYEAVGLRLNDGLDYPYYFTRGFSQDFVEKEMNLCEKDKEGVLIVDREGNATLECMCGKVISGLEPSDCPFFTEFGSFWTNSTTCLLDSTTDKERQIKTRNRCNKEGYESVALIPVRVDGETFGLLQLNDHRKNRFTLELITFFESVATSIGLLFAMKRTHQQLKEKTDDIKRLAISRMAQLNHLASLLKGQIDQHRTDVTTTEVMSKLDDFIKEVDMLKGIMTICCGCKKIRNKNGDWEQIERYISGHSQAQFSHSYCPDCLDIFMAQHRH